MHRHHRPGADDFRAETRAPVTVSGQQQLRGCGMDGYFFVPGIGRMVVAVLGVAFR